MVLNNVTKFHKILIKTIPLGEQTSFGVTYGQRYGWMAGQGQHLMSRPLSWQGHCHGQGHNNSGLISLPIPLLQSTARFPN